MDVYTIVLAGIFLAAVAAFAALLVLDARYGRYLRGGWGVALTARSAWFTMEFQAALSIFLMAYFGRRSDPFALFFLVVWEVHYLYRSLVYPALIRGNRSRSVPITLILMAIVYNCANGYVNGYHLFHAPGGYPADWLLDPRFLCGMLLFGAGMAIHVHSDRTLQKLRTRGHHEYQIPHGGLFRYVSSPNYLGEMVQWCGFAIATWSLAGLSFAVLRLVPDLLMISGESYS